MSDFLDIASGASAGMNAIGGLANRIGQKKREKRQLGYQKDLMGLQQSNQMALNEQGRDLSMDIWNRTNYGPQVQKMKEAGINPALMYGGTGAGGSTSGMGGGSAGSGAAPKVENMPMDISALSGLSKLKEEKALLTAQKENVDADTALKGKQTTKTGAETGNLMQDIENKKAQEILTKAQTRNVNLDNTFKGKSMEDSLSVLSWAVDQNESDARSMRAQAYVDENTKDQKVDILNAEAVGAWLQNALTSENISKTKEETRVMGEKLVQLIRQVDQSGESVDIKSFEADVKANFPSVMNVLGAAGEHGVRQLLGIFGRGKAYVKRK